MRKIKEIYSKLYKKYGRQHWWPVSSSQNAELEIILGAILTQNTSWKNVEKAIENLNKNNLIDIKKLNEINSKRLAIFIKSSGYYNQKAKKIKNFITFVVKNYDSNLLNLKKLNIKKLRKELLTINGIGRETADSIILYAFNKPIFVVDAYTKRIFERLFNVKFKDYDELQELFHKNLLKNHKLFNEYHALIVEHGKNICRKKPLCEICIFEKKCLFSITS